jgi:uncharacterized protein YcfL
MKYLIALFCLALLVGCGVHPPIQGRQDPYARGQIHFSKDDLRTQTAVDAPQVARDDSGDILHVTVPIRSAINKRLYVDYRVSFFDKSGQLLNQTGWMTKTLEMNTPDQITVNSMSPRAADFQVDFRWAR